MNSSRYEPCRLLQASRIPFIVWGEDALKHYGVPTCLFDLYLVVPDIDAAAAVLASSGWQPSVARYPRSVSHRRLSSPLKYAHPLPSGDTSPVVSLLPSSDWNYTFDLDHQTKINTATEMNMFPPLPCLVDALIDVLLSIPEPSEGLYRLASLWVSYLYGYVPIVKTRQFADQLRFDNRQFHLDAVSGMPYNMLPYLRHARALRLELQQGTRQLVDCSSFTPPTPPGRPLAA